MNIEYVGYVAAVLSTVWSLPQAIQAVRTGSIRDVSPQTTVVYLCSMIVATAFAFGIHSRPVIVTNLAGILVFLPVAVLRLRADESGALMIRRLPLYLAATALVVAVVPTAGLGYAAGAVNWWSVLSQIRRCERTRSVSDISLAAISVRTVGLVLWTTYSLSIWVVPLFVTNLVSLALAIVLVSMRLAYGRVAGTLARV